MDLSVVRYSLIVSPSMLLLWDTLLPRVLSKLRNDSYIRSHVLMSVFKALLVSREYVHSLDFCGVR